MTAEKDFDTFKIYTLDTSNTSSTSNCYSYIDQPNLLFGTESTCDTSSSLYVSSLGLDWTDEMKYSKELEQEFIKILKKSDAGECITDREASMLFHYARHKDEPEYQFVNHYYERLKNKKTTTKNKGE